jgi:hypothetical protein
MVLVLAAACVLWISRTAWLPHVTSTNPFQATPAENFPSGDAGLVLPPAEPVAGMTSAQVAEDENRVKQALEASYLDQRLLVGHDPQPLLRLLAPDSATAVRATFDSGGYGTALVRLAPGTALAAPPRVSGQVRYARVDWNGIPTLDVTSNYVFAYAFAVPPGVVVVHTETHWMFPLADNLRPSSRGMYLGPTKGYWHGMDCTAALQGLTAPAQAGDRDAKPGFRDPDPVDAYFDPNRPVRVGSACR